MRKAFVGGISVFFLMIVFVVPVWAAPASITDVQYWLAPDHIQTIISFDREVQPAYHHRSDPDRFVLEIPSCAPLYGKQTLAVNDVTLQQIRVQQLTNGTTQVVFDLTQKVDVTVHTLARFNGQPDRVIVNLFDKATQQKVEQERVERHQITRELKQNSFYIVVLDPGHGGRDPGAIGPTGLKEKEVVLDVAKQIQAIIQKKAPNIKVYLTRDKDYYLSLPKRTEIAQEYNADLFLSLHVNANPSRKAHGFSVYTLSEKATDKAARQLAEKENAADLLFGGMETPTPNGGDSLLKFVLADLSATASLQHSLEFGRISIDTTMAGLKEFGIKKEGLKRANFVVLRSGEMPAALIEACYISNKREAGLLGRKDFRAKMAHALAESIMEYFRQIPETERPQMVELRDKHALTESNMSQESEYKIHVVKSGESLSLIAGKYKVNLARLRQANQLASADLIYVGQQLWIP